MSDLTWLHQEDDALNMYTDSDWMDLEEEEDEKSNWDRWDSSESYVENKKEED